MAGWSSEIIKLSDDRQLSEFTASSADLNICPSLSLLQLSVQNGNIRRRDKPCCTNIMDNRLFVEW